MQEQLFGLIRIDILLETIAGIIAMMVSHYANQAFLLTKQKKLSDLSTGFLVLSAAMFCRVIGTLYFFVLFQSDTSEAISIISLVIVAYGVLKIMAFAIFAFATHSSRREESFGISTVMVMTLPFLISPLLEMIAVFFIVIVVLQTFRNYLSVRSKYALYVFIGFLLLLLSHVSGLMIQEDNIRSYWLYIASQLLQFLGYFSFLLLLRKSGRNG